MDPKLRSMALLTLMLAAVALAAPADVNAQNRARGNAPQPTSSPSVTAGVTISLGDRDVIREFYATHEHPGVEALPPGIRRNLERGKPLPPGIAKRVPPSDLRSRITVPERYELVEVGLDVLLVEAATGIIHDVLMDVIR